MDLPLSATRARLRAASLLIVLCACAAVGWRVWHERPAQPSTAPSPAIAAPQAAAPAQPAEPGAPTFDIVRVAPDGGLVVAGQAEPGSTVTIKRGDSVVAQVQADDRGGWVAVPLHPLEPGSGELTLSARNPAGQVRTAETTALIVVPAPAPPNGPSSAPGLAVLSTPAAPSRLLQAPSQAPLPGASAAKLGLATVDYDDNGAIRFSGTAAPGGTVRVYVDNQRSGDAAADASGRWTLSPDQPVAPGLHRLRVDQVGARGKVASRVEVPFERETLALAQVRPGQVVVQPGQNLWRLARRVYGTGLRYTVIYAANREQIRDVQRIYPGQVFAVPAVEHENRE